MHSVTLGVLHVHADSHAQVWPGSSSSYAAIVPDGFNPAPLRMVDMRKLAFALADGAGRPRLLGTPCLRALHWVGTSILISTRCGELLHLDYAASSEAPDVTLLLQGHCQIGSPPAALLSLPADGAPMLASLLAYFPEAAELRHVPERAAVQLRS